VIAVATEELGKFCSRVQPRKSLCMVPFDTGHELVEVIRAMVPVVRDTSSLGAPLAKGLSLRDGPPASHNENYVHSWLQDTVEAHELLLDMIGARRRCSGGGPEGDALACPSAPTSTSARWSLLNLMPYNAWHRTG
jgi:hypothetical protein